MCFPVLIIGSAGVAAAQNIFSLLFWRFLQSMGGLPGAILGAGVIGDLFKLEERGRAMGVFFAVSQLSSTIWHLYPDFDYQACWVPLRLLRGSYSSHD